MLLARSLPEKGCLAPGPSTDFELHVKTPGSLRLTVMTQPSSRFIPPPAHPGLDLQVMSRVMGMNTDA